MGYRVIPNSKKKEEDVMNTLLKSRDYMFEPFRQQFDKLFDQIVGSDSLSTVKSLTRSGYPKMDIYYTKDEFIIEASVPGLKTENIKVEIIPCRDDNFCIQNGNILKISGEMDYSYQHEKNTTYAVKELRRSHFERSILLPEGIIDEPVATLSDGILKLVWKYPNITPTEARIIPIRQLESKI
jgi:HSP20 family molecular chaperone IbpA